MKLKKIKLTLLYLKMKNMYEHADNVYGFYLYGKE